MIVAVEHPEGSVLTPIAQARAQRLWHRHGERLT